MSSFVRDSIAAVGQFLPMQLLRRGNYFPPFMPFYHLVSNKQPEYINSYRVKNEAEFENDLDELLQYFKPVALEEVIQSPAKNRMHLSFDDGLKECATIIAPILRRKGIPATFFVSPKFVDNKALFHRFKQAVLENKGLLRKDEKKYALHENSTLDQLAQKHNIDFGAYQPYMTLQEIQQLNNAGFTIGAHSLNHPEMWLLSEDEQFRQVAESMQWVVDHFNPKIKAFSFPFTDDGIKLSLFKRLAKEQITDVTFGTAGLKYDVVPNHYQRIPLEKEQNWSVKKAMHFEYFYYFVRSFWNRNRVARD